MLRYYQWRSNRVCKACTARSPITVGGKGTLCQYEGALLESLLQPCYAGGLGVSEPPLSSQKQHITPSAEV